MDVGKARLMFWDLGGQEELQSLWDKVRWMGATSAPWHHLCLGGTLVSSFLFSEGLGFFFFPYSWQLL